MHNPGYQRRKNMRAKALNESNSDVSPQITNGCKRIDANNQIAEIQGSHHGI